MRLEDVSMIIPHQASAHVLRGIAEVLNIPFSRMQTNLESHANTAGATVPLLLDQVNRRGLIHKGDLLLLVSIGAGWTLGATLYRW
jgi:3-oxoacyl-[acyl-carrier-protein] synthase-3